ncbi:MAG: DUF6541 family protein [Nanoarchaeota archaeon]
MQISKKYEVIVIACLYLIALYLWTLPINDMPFGDVDSSVHFTSGDYMVQKDKSLSRLPSYLEFAIGGGTKGRFAYPPQFNVNLGIAEIIGGARIISPYLFIAILCSLGVIGIYLLVRNLYGVLAGLSAGFLMIFSRRDIMYYLFGLWPQTLAFTFVPVVIYSYYKFIISESENKQRIYLIITGLLIGFQYTFHPQAFFFSIAFIIIYSGIILLIKKKLPFKIRDIMALGFLVIILIVILAPFQLGFLIRNIGPSKESAQAGGEFGFKPENIGRLFHWFKVDEKYFSGLPPNYFSYKYIYGGERRGYIGYWTLSLLILGAIFIFIRRKEQDILVIAWEITLYLFLHMEIIGGNRNFRFLQLEAQLFSLLTVVGLLGIASFFKFSNEKKTYLKYSFVVAFLIVVIISNAKPIYNELSNSYKGIGRITPPEYKATEWVMTNTDENANFLLIGTVAYNKKKWLQGLSFRRFDYDNNLITQKFEGIVNPDYVFVDYSDLFAIGRADIIQQLQGWEKAKLENATLVYNQDNIRVYKIGNQKWEWN